MFTIYILYVLEGEVVISFVFDFLIIDSECYIVKKNGIVDTEC